MDLAEARFSTVAPCAVDEQTPGFDCISIPDRQDAEGHSHAPDAQRLVVAIAPARIVSERWLQICPKLAKCSPQAAGRGRERLELHA